MVRGLLLFLVFSTICGAAAASPIDECILYSPSLVGHCALLHGGYKDAGSNPGQKALADTRDLERLRAGATQVADSNFTSAIPVKKDDALSFAGRGWAKFSDRDFFGSISDYDQAIRLAPSNPQLYLERCHINIVIEKLENAIRDCTEAIRLDSKLDQAFNARGLAYARGGNFARGLQDYNSAIKQNPLRTIN